MENAGADGGALVFAVPGLGAHDIEAEGAAGPVVTPSGGFSIQAVRADHARPRPRSASGTLAELDGAALGAFLRGYYSPEGDLELSDTYALEVAAQAVVPAAASGRSGVGGRAAEVSRWPGALVQGLRSLLGGGGSLPASGNVVSEDGFDDPADEEEEVELEEDEYLPPGVQPAAEQRAPRSRAHCSGRRASVQPAPIDPQALLAAGAQINDVVQLKMLQLLSDCQPARRRTGYGDDPGGSSDSDGEDGLGRDRHMARGVRAIHDVQRIRRRIKSEPARRARGFDKAAREELGVLLGGAWTLEEWVREQHWGRMTEAQRCARGACAVMQALRRSEVPRAPAQAVQNLKATLQSALNRGEWTQALLLTAPPAPMSSRSIAGNDDEMTAVTGYAAAVADLRAKSRLWMAVSPGAVRHQDGAEGDDGGAMLGPKAIAKNRGRGGHGGAAAEAAAA